MSVPPFDLYVCPLTPCLIYPIPGDTGTKHFMATMLWLKDYQSTVNHA